MLLKNTYWWRNIAAAEILMTKMMMHRFKFSVFWCSGFTFIFNIVLKFESLTYTTNQSTNRQNKFASIYIPTLLQIF